MIQIEKKERLLRSVPIIEQQQAVQEQQQTAKKQQEQQVSNELQKKHPLKQNNDNEHQKR